MSRRVVHSADEMRQLGRDLGSHLQGGDVVVLSGPVGAGKTTLTQGIAAGFEIPDQVTSPTFVIAREYTGNRGRLVHVDAYRIGSDLELDDLDIEVEGAIVVVEWGSPMAHVLTDDPFLIEIAISTNPDEREVTLDARLIGARP